jgi:hypothetical protein
MSKAHKEPCARAPVSSEIAGAVWRSLPWQARLPLLLHWRWPRLTRLPLFGRWFAWAAVRMITEVGVAKKRRREGALPDSGLSPSDPVRARGDRLISRIVVAVGVALILARHLGGLLLSLSAFALLIPFMLWPPLWPEIKIAIDAARRDLEDDRDDEPDPR